MKIYVKSETDTEGSKEMAVEAINKLKEYTSGKKNTEKVEISVLQLNRIIKALEKES